MSTAANNLIKEFCQSIGMDGLGFDDNRQRSLCFDDKVVITFLGDDGDGITAVCFVAELGKPENMRMLLEQNFLAEAHGGARFALEPTQDRVVMTRQWDAVKISVPEFSDNLEAFVNSALQAQEFFDKGGLAPADTAVPSTSGDSLSQAYQSL